MTRQLRPRATSALVVAPITVTDRTCAAVLGIEPRAFREWLAEENIEHRRIGRRVIARVDVVLAALEAMPAQSSDTASESSSDRPALQSADDLLARLGRRRTA